MPRAANIFDNISIADVMVTVEYAALHSENYRHHVVQQMNRPVSAEIAYNLRHQLADPWHNLSDPD